MPSVAVRSKVKGPVLEHYAIDDESLEGIEQFLLLWRRGTGNSTL